jgi:hypothetical protein
VQLYILDIGKLEFDITPKLIFREVWSKENVSWLDNGAEVEYAPAKTFYFREDLSVGPESTKITTLNIPMIVRGSVVLFLFIRLIPTIIPIH